MTVEAAFCTSCGAVVGDTWQSCEACGAAQEVDPRAVEAAAARAPLPGVQAVARPATTPASTYLTVIGGALVAVGIVLFLVAFGFPPGTTTTYEVNANGMTTESTSPGTVEAILPFLLCIVGAVLLRAAKVAKVPTRK